MEAPAPDDLRGFELAVLMFFSDFCHGRVPREILDLEDHLTICFGSFGEKGCQCSLPRYISLDAGYVLSKKAMLLGRTAQQRCLDGISLT